MKKKILVIGDSLSLPGHKNSYEDTWYFKLKKCLGHSYDFIPYLRRALTSDILVNQGGGDKVDNFPRGADLLEHYMPDIVIIQLGIVDCSPRLFNRNAVSTKLVNILPKILKNFIYAIKLKNGRKAKNAYVNAERFLFNFDTYVQRAFKCNVQKMIIIGIGYPDSRMIKKNPRILESIDRYNGILTQIADQRKNIDYILPLDARKANQSIYQDGYHPNNAGHDLVFKALIDILH